MTAAALAGSLIVPTPGVRAARLHLTVDPAEHRRRAQAGCGPITSLGTLAQLMDLPAGFPVALASLPERDRKAIRRLLRGAVTIADGHVTQHAVRPATVHLATVHGTVTRANLGRAGSFAPFCARAIITPARPRRSETLIEADFWGITPAAPPVPVPGSGCTSLRTPARSGSRTRRRASGRGRAGHERRHGGGRLLRQRGCSRSHSHGWPPRYSQASPSPSRSRPARYPGSPRYSGAAPAARASVQLE